MLAYWTDGNERQMDRLFRRSGLMRPKWDKFCGSQTYGERTLIRAIS
jgi:primase-polymerase (primpol)-like protein